MKQLPRDKQMFFLFMIIIVLIIIVMYFLSRSIKKSAEKKYVRVPEGEEGKVWEVEAYTQKLYTALDRWQNYDGSLNELLIQMKLMSDTELALIHNLWAKTYEGQGMIIKTGSLIEELEEETCGFGLGITCENQSEILKRLRALPKSK